MSRCNCGAPVGVPHSKICALRLWLEQDCPEFNGFNQELDAEFLYVAELRLIEAYRRKFPHIAEMWAMPSTSEKDDVPTDAGGRRFAAIPESPWYGCDIAARPDQTTHSISCAVPIYRKWWQFWKPRVRFETRIMRITDIA